MRGKIVLLVLVGLALAGGASAASSRRHVCRPPARARVLASNRKAVLFSRGGDRFYGCLKALGVTRLLLHVDPTFDALIAVRLAGRFAALEPAYSYKDTSEDVMLYDLRRGKATHLAHVEWGPTTDTSGIEGLDFLALDSSGFAAWRKTSRPPPNGLAALSCPSPSLCVASDGAGNILTSSNPLGGAGAWSRTASDQLLGISGVSCPSISMCVAGDTSGNILTSTDPSGGASAWRKTQATDRSSGLGAVSCPSVSLCLAVDYAGNLFTSTDPTGGAGAWTKTKIATGFGNSLGAVSCPSVWLCVAGDQFGNLFTSTDPTGGAGAWKKTKIDTTGYNRLEGVSCPSISMCVAGDYSGNIWTSTDPTGGASAWKKTKKDTETCSAPSPARRSRCA